MRSGEVNAENQKFYSTYRAGDHLHFICEHGGVKNSWQTVLRRQVINSDTGDLIDDDRQIASRCKEFLERPVQGG
eukprot:1970143-Karenia_brevis.AAC.1